MYEHLAMEVVLVRLESHKLIRNFYLFLYFLYHIYPVHDSIPIPEQLMLMLMLMLNMFKSLCIAIFRELDRSHENR